MNQEKEIGIKAVLKYLALNIKANEAMEQKVQYHSPAVLIILIQLILLAIFF